MIKHCTNTCETSLKHCTNTCETSLKHCTNNLKQHLKVLKQETNTLKNTVLNGGRISLQELRNYNEHKTYVKALLQKEKFKTYNNILKQHLTKS